MKQLSFLSAFIFIIYFLACGASIVSAQEMKSQNFVINEGNFNMTSGSKSSSNFKLSDVVGQTAAGIFASKGYIIQSGFLNSAAGGVFTFSVSPTVIDFGLLSAGIPLSRKITITISNGDVPGYTVKASENQPLSTIAGAQIIDTACDGENGNTCTIRHAAPWKKNNTFGFGYNMKGKTVPEDFIKETSFRPFPATRRGEKPAVIMETQARKVVDQAQMTLKLNINKQQPVGRYHNVISFSAVAGI